MDWRTKIEALLNKAQSTNSKHEAEALRERAEYLMQKFGIEDAVARSKEPIKEKPIMKEFHLGQPYPARKSELLRMIAKCLGGSVVINGKAVGGIVWVFAFKEDVARIEMLYASLLAQMHIEMHMTPVPSHVNGKTFRNSWILGFISGVDERLKRAMRKANQEVPGSDLVLVNRKKEVESARDGQFPALVFRRVATQNVSQQAFGAGREAGQRADIGQRRMGGGRPQLSG